MYYILFCLFSFYFSLTLKAATSSGTITSDETWSGMHIVTGDILIQSGVVTIEPGTIVKFATTNNNRINGDYSHIYLIIRGEGGLTAIGTPEAPIVFTTLSSNKTVNMWGGIDIEGLIYDSTTVFKYCNFEYANTAIDFRNPSWISEISEVTFEYCNFSYMQGSGIYITSGGKAWISYCTFYHCEGSGVFSHPASELHISYSAFNDVCSGIICAGGVSPWYQKVYIDHVSIYNVDLRYGWDNPKTWHGHGISTINSNPAGEVYVTNTIVQKAMSSGFLVNTPWKVQNDYNCWYDNNWGSVYGGDVGPHGLDEVDPQMVDPANNDFRLYEGSPCIGTANDGTNIGYSQEVIPKTEIKVIVSNQEKETAFSPVRRLYNLQGREIFDLEFSPGIYLFYSSIPPPIILKIFEPAR